MHPQIVPINPHQLSQQAPSEFPIFLGNLPGSAMIVTPLRGVLRLFLKHSTLAMGFRAMLYEVCVSGLGDELPRKSRIETWRWVTLRIWVM
jgi:hypothetical protein